MKLRFAPSPTGALHIGGARTALYNWLTAQRNGAGMVLRIEDTDLQRSLDEHTAQILDALAWLGITHDGDTVFQSRRADRHRELLEQLLESGAAYRCTAGKEQVDAWKAEHGRDRGFRGIPEAQGAVRLRVPDDGDTVMNDLIRGETRFPNRAIDDPVIARADGSVLYNFAVAVDDWDAGVTLVIRGEDHVSNTPKQLLVLHALGAPTPTYAHVPLLHGPDGAKLSKRHGAASVQELRDAGYLPEAVRSYIAKLGWGTEEDRVLSTPELIREFDIAQVRRSPAQFDERKLRWVNGRFMRELAPAEYTRRVAEHLGRPADERLAAACAVAQEKAQTLNEVWPLIRFIFEAPVTDEKAWKKVMKDDAGALLAQARDVLAALPAWEADAVETALHGLLEDLDVKPGKLFQPLRVAITGSTVSPGIHHTLTLIDRDTALARIDAAVAQL